MDKYQRPARYILYQKMRVVPEAVSYEQLEPSFWYAGTLGLIIEPGQFNGETNEIAFVKQHPVGTGGDNRTGLIAVP